MSRRLPSLDDNRRMATPVARTWERLTEAIDKQNASDRQTAHQADVHLREAGLAAQDGAKGSASLYQSRGQRTSWLPRNIGVSWSAFMGNALSVGRDVRFSCCEEAGWYLDDDDHSDRSVVVDGS